MSPLRVEVYNPEAEQWSQPGPEIKPGDPPGSLSDNKPDGTRDLYLFRCLPGDSKSVIYRSGFGLDAEFGQLRWATPDSSKLEIVKELVKGESFEITVKTDKSPQPRLIRFTHKWKSNDCVQEAIKKAIKDYQKKKTDVE